MQQYIYGNIGQKNYVYVSSEPEFFDNAQRTAVLSHLMSYETFCNHGELYAHEHQSYWMVVSNLDNPGDVERLYIQASGGDPHRTSFYVRGYMSDLADGDLYGPQLLNLLCTRFTSFEETMRDASAGGLKGLTLEEMPTEPQLQPCQVDPELMRCILLALLQKKKVYIRIPSVGRQAMKESRELLLAIYQRLPYEQRRVNGFYTGGSMAKLNDTNALPAAISLVLMDGDADVTGMYSDSFQAFFDMTKPETLKPMRRTDKNGRSLTYVPLMDFLAEQSVDVLEDYFRFCRSCLKADVDGNKLGIQDYLMYLGFFNIGRGQCDADTFRNWAANIFTNASNNEKWTPEIKKVLFARIAGVLSPETLTSYFRQALPDFDALNTFGALDDEERHELRMADKAEGGVRDVNAALTLRMAEHLLKHYAEGTREAMTASLQRHLVQLGCEKYPCLVASRPTAETMEELGKITIPADRGNTTAMVAQLKNGVSEELNHMRSQVRQNYAEARGAQLEAGLARIREFTNTLCDFGQLYNDLKTHYLHAELLKPDAGDGWNKALGDLLVSICGAIIPRSLQEMDQLLKLVRSNYDVFSRHGGALSREQMAVIDRMTMAWCYVINTQKGTCSSEADLRGQIDGISAVSILLEQYPPEAQEALIRTLVDRLTGQALAVWPWLTEEKPTAETAAALKGIDMPTDFEPTAAGAVRSMVWHNLESCRAQVLRLYEKELSEQGNAGLRLIRDWSEQETDLQVLYSRLQQMYLFPELIRGGEGSAWNHAVGNALMEQCRRARPEKLEEYHTLLQREDANRRLFEEHGGTFTEEQNHIIWETRTNWEYIITLRDRPCETLEVLLELFAEVTGAGLAPALTADLMLGYTRTLMGTGVSRKHILEFTPELCRRAVDPAQKKLLQLLVASVKDLNVLMQSLTPANALDWLEKLCRLEKAGLYQGEVEFRAWNMTGRADILAQRISGLLYYRKGDQEPGFRNDLELKWTAENLQENTDLMLRLALSHTSHRATMIRALARNHRSIQPAEIRSLYACGCTQELLKAGAGEETTTAWKNAVEAVFPKWPELPEPLVNPEVPPVKTGTGLMIAQAVLLALTGLVPAIVMLATSLYAGAACIGTMAMLGVTAVVCLISGLLSRDGNRKRLLLMLAAASLPGVIASLVVLLIH